MQRNKEQDIGYNEVNRRGQVPSIDPGRARLPMEAYLPPVSCLSFCQNPTITCVKFSSVQLSSFYSHFDIMLNLQIICKVIKQ